MDESEWEPVHGILMTSERVAAYGGVGFAPEALEQVASAIRGGAIPFHLDHDLRKPVRARNLDAFVRAREDGIYELRFTLEVHPDDVERFGDRAGMSATITVPLDREDSHPEPLNPLIEVSADAAWFPTNELLAAETTLIGRGVPADKIRTEHALQFSFTPDPQIFVTLGLDLLNSLGASAIWAGIVRIFRGRSTPRGGDARGTTRINVTITNGVRSVTAVVETNDEYAARRAFDALEELGRQTLDGSAPKGQVRDALGTSSVPQVAMWDDPARQWVPPS